MPFLGRRCRRRRGDPVGIQADLVRVHAGRNSLVVGVAMPVHRVEGTSPGGPAVDDELLSWVPGGRADSADRPLRIPSVGIEVWRAGGLRDLNSRQRVAVIALLSVPLAEFEHRDQYSGRVTVGAGTSALSHQGVHGFLRAQLRSAARGVAARGLVHDRPAPAPGRGADHPAGGRLWWRAGQTPGRHAGKIHSFDGRQLPIRHPDGVLGRLDTVRARDPGGDAHEVTPRMGTGDLHTAGSATSTSPTRQPRTRRSPRTSVSGRFRPSSRTPTRAP